MYLKFKTVTKDISMGLVDRSVFVDPVAITEVRKAGQWCSVVFADGTVLALRESADEVTSKINSHGGRALPPLPTHRARTLPRLPAFVFHDDPLCVWA